VIFTRMMRKSWIRVKPGALDEQAEQQPVFRLGASLREDDVVQCPNDMVRDAIVAHLNKNDIQCEILEEYHPAPPIDLGPIFWHRFREFNRSPVPLEYCQRDLDWRPREDG
jgi:hypothetical protein